MIIKTRGIILRAVKYSETSFITDIYTEAKGLKSYIISGVRSSKAKTKSSLMQVMSLVDMVVYHRDEKELNRIKEIKAAQVFTQIPFNITRSAVGLFMVELARKTIRETEENKSLFDFLFHTFYFLDTTLHPVANIHLAFMTQLSSYLGFMPGGIYQPNLSIFNMEEGTFQNTDPKMIHCLDQRNSDLVYQLLTISLEECHTIPMNRTERKVLLNKLLDYYRLHVEDFTGLNAHQILQEVLE